MKNEKYKAIKIKESVYNQLKEIEKEDFMITSKNEEIDKIKIKIPMSNLIQYLIDYYNTHD